MKRILSILLLLASFSGNAQFVINSFKTSNGGGGGGGGSWTEIRVDMRGAGTSSGTTGYNTLAGSPHSSVLTISNLNDITGTATGIGLTTVATANWSAYSGCSCSNNDAVSGITAGNYLGTGGSTEVYSSIIFNYGTVSPARYDATKPQFRLSGLDPATTYTIKITGGDGSLGFAANWVSRVVGGTSPSLAEVNGNVTNVTVGATFTLQPDGSGNIDIWFNSSTTNSGDLAPVAGLVISK
jgi:hypothetical protein